MLEIITFKNVHPMLWMFSTLGISMRMIHTKEVVYLFCLKEYYMGLKELKILPRIVPTIVLICFKAFGFSSHQEYHVSQHQNLYAILVDGINEMWTKTIWHSSARYLYNIKKLHQW